MKYNMDEMIYAEIDGDEYPLYPSEIQDAKQGYLFVPSGYLQILLAVVSYDGTCGLNDLGGSTSLRKEQEQSYKKVGSGTICWYKPDPTSKMHACAACCSLEYELYDTGIRVPSLRSYSTAI